jgi:hypothetical protein
MTALIYNQEDQKKKLEFVRLNRVEGAFEANNAVFVLEKMNRYKVRLQLYPSTCAFAKAS